MSDKLGMSINGYAKIERGETSIIHQSLPQIVEILGLTLANLFENECAEHQNIRTSEHQNIIFELEKARLVVNYQKEILEQKKAEITCLKEIISLLKQQ